MADAAAKVDLTDKDSLKVNIADALNEQDIVKFTINTVTTLDRFQKPEFQATRTHEDFLWLHEQYHRSGKYDGLIIPPSPPKPDFSQSHGKLAKLQAGDDQMPQAELKKLKQEIQSEYLSAFQKTVAMHEVFLIRLVHHPIMKEEQSLQIFLEYDKDLANKKANAMDKTKKAFFGALTTMTATDPLKGHVDPEEFFGRQKDFIISYQAKIAEAVASGTAKVKGRAAVVSQLSRFHTQLTHLGNTQANHHVMSEIMRKNGAAVGTYGTVQKKLTAKEDLKMGDLLRYYKDDSMAARELMVRRVKAYKEMLRTDKELEKAKAKGKNVIVNQEANENAKTTYDKITKSAEAELNTFQKRRLAAFRKGLIQYTQVQIRQSRESFALWKQTLDAVKLASA